MQHVPAAGLKQASLISRLNERSVRYDERPGSDSMLMKEVRWPVEVRVRGTKSPVSRTSIRSDPMYVPCQTTGRWRSADDHYVLDRFSEFRFCSIVLRTRLISSP